MRNRGWKRVKDEGCCPVCHIGPHEGHPLVVSPTYPPASVLLQPWLSTHPWTFQQDPAWTANPWDAVLLRGHLHSWLGTLGPILLISGWPHHLWSPNLCGDLCRWLPLLPIPCQPHAWAHGTLLAWADFTRGGLGRRVWGFLRPCQRFCVQRYGLCSWSRKFDRDGAALGIDWHGTAKHFCSMPSKHTNQISPRAPVVWSAGCRSLRHSGTHRSTCTTLWRICNWNAYRRHCETALCILWHGLLQHRNRFGHAVLCFRACGCKLAISSGAHAATSGDSSE